MAVVPDRIRAVVFDFDGVILESADVKTNAFVDLFADHGAAIVAGVRAHHLANLGISRFKKFAWIYENLLGRAITEAESAELGRRFGDLALQRVLEAPFVPGAREAVAQLAAQLPLFVASCTPQDELDLIVDRRQLRPYFREVWGAPAEKPVILRDLMARHGLAPSEIMFVGDGMSDYKAAVAAEVQFLARDTPDLHDEWMRIGVQRRPDLVDLPSVVSGWC